MRCVYGAVEMTRTSLMILIEQEALEAALTMFPTLCHVRRERIRLHIRFLNPDADAQSLVEVTVSPEAWSELVSGL